MKKITIMFTMLISANIYANEISICDGRFESGQPVHVRIDWDTKDVDVNKFKTFIETVIDYGIGTGTTTNKLDQEVFFVIGHFKNRGTFVAQQQIAYGQISLTNFARLSCSKSFYKPFSDRMLDA